MSSSADIVAAMRSLDLSRSPDPSNPKTESIKTKTTDFKPKPKSHKSQPAKTNVISIPKGQLGSQSSKSQPPKSQPERSTVYTSVGPPPNIVNKADVGGTSQFQARAKPGAVPTSLKKIRRSPRNHTKGSNSAVPSATSLSSPPLSTLAPLKSQTKSPPRELTEKVPQQIFKYIVQASEGPESSEGIIGEYSELKKANEFANGYVGRWGVGKSEIADIQSSCGCTARVDAYYIDKSNRTKLAKAISSILLYLSAGHFKICL